MKGWFRKRGKITTETARRVTGISSPFGGLQWADPGPSDSEIVRRLILFLEDRPVLHNSANVEVMSQIERSIDEIREECTKVLQALKRDALATPYVRTIRTACRRFHDQHQEAVRRDGGFWDRELGTPESFDALDDFRATVVQQVALLARHYDIDVEGELAAVATDLEGDER